jgi:hypothetical protein
MLEYKEGDMIQKCSLPLWWITKWISKLKMAINKSYQRLVQNIKKKKNIDIDCNLIFKKTYVKSNCTSNNIDIGVYFLQSLKFSLTKSQFFWTIKI